jgi:hypothetical protein
MTPEYTIYALWVARVGRGPSMLWFNRTEKRTP